MSTLPDRLAELYGDRPALFLDQPLDYPFFRGDCVTHRDLARFVARIAHGLQQLGVKKGDRVGLMTGNRIEAAFAEFAAQRLGAVPVPLNFMLRLDEIRFLAEDCGFRTFVTDRSVFENVIRDRAAVPSIENWFVVTSQAVPAGVVRMQDLMADQAESFPAAPLAPDDLAIISTPPAPPAFPKGAMLSDAALMFAIRSYGKLVALLPSQRHTLSLLVMPLAHTSGHQALLLQLVMGMPMLLMGRFDPRRVLEAIQEYKVTMFSGIPAMYRMLLDAGAREYRPDVDRAVRRRRRCVARRVDPHLSQSRRQARAFRPHQACRVSPVATAWPRPRGSWPPRSARRAATAPPARSCAACSTRSSIPTAVRCPRARLASWW